mmetsp:Transcript_43806/g.89481  ORF Transcript_43806/g.89481 Transcript_43806/m.89481 type:complete len:230 (+) Transcript_43806:338-1027(+)
MHRVGDKRAQSSSITGPGRPPSIVTEPSLPTHPISSFLLPPFAPASSVCPPFAPSSSVFSPQGLSAAVSAFSPFASSSGDTQNSTSTGRASFPAPSVSCTSLNLPPSVSAVSACVCAASLLSPRLPSSPISDASTSAAGRAPPHIVVDEPSISAGAGTRKGACGASGCSAMFCGAFCISRPSIVVARCAFLSSHLGIGKGGCGVSGSTTMFSGAFCSSLSPASVSLRAS